MYLLSDFQSKIRDAVSSRPTAAAAYQAGDPRVLASVQAMAAMLAMVSQQIDLAESEPFLKARDGTVLADATMKGVLPLGKTAKATILVSNGGTSSVSIAVGRILLDSNGRRWTVDAAATVPAAVGAVNGTATVSASQYTTRTLTHTVAGSVPFYEVQVAPSADGLYLVGLAVSDPDGAYAYSADFCNVAAGDRTYHVETDEYRRLWLRFGASDTTFGPVVGYQPPNGKVLSIIVTECEGLVSMDTGASFALQTVATTAESLLTLTLSALTSTGANPPTMEVLRTLARYPALNDSNAVYLSNFDFLLRRQLAGIQFLSVWNEQIEEAARGANILNMNKLFVAFVIPSQTAAISQAQVTAVVARADNSLRLSFVAASVVTVPVTINAQVSAVYDPADIEAQIRTVVLAKYGATSTAAARGQASISYQVLAKALVDAIPALQDAISDFNVSVGATATPKPEDYRYVTAASLTVNVTRLQASTGLWSG